MESSTAIVPVYRLPCIDLAFFGYVRELGDETGCILSLELDTDDTFGARVTM